MSLGIFSSIVCVSSLADIDAAEGSPILFLSMLLLLAVLRLLILLDEREADHEIRVTSLGVLQDVT